MEALGDGGKLSEGDLIMTLMGRNNVYIENLNHKNKTSSDSELDKEKKDGNKVKEAIPWRNVTGCARFEHLVGWHLVPRTCNFDRTSRSPCTVLKMEANIVV